METKNFESPAPQSTSSSPESTPDQTPNSAEKWAKLATDSTFAPEQPSSSLSSEELSRIARGARNVAMGLEEDYYRYIRRQAKKNSLPADDLLSEVRAFNKEAIFGKDRENFKFYHSTSLDSLSKILDTGELLSRPERAARGEDLSQLPASSSEYVQFTFDRLGEDGELVGKSGLSDSTGAVGSEISFVFGDELIDEDSFDAAQFYPTVNKVSLADKCLGIIVNNTANTEKVTAMLKAKGLEIPIYTADAFDPKTPAKDLRALKARQRVKRSLHDHHTDSLAPETTDSTDPIAPTAPQNTAASQEVQKLQDMPNLQENLGTQDTETQDTDSQDTDIQDSETQNQESGIELLTEAELANVLGLLDASKPDLGQISALARGSRSAEESTAALRTLSKEMFERSDALLQHIQYGRNLGEVELYQDVYEQDMSSRLGHSLQVLQALRDRAKTLPQNLAVPFIFHLHQIENKLLMVNQIVSRRHNSYNRDQSAFVPKEKLVADEEESNQYPDVRRF